MPTGGFYTGAQPIPSSTLSKWGKALFGDKPDVPDLPRIDLPEEQQKAIDANIAAEPGAGKLARLSQEQIKAMMNFAFPGFGTITELAPLNIISMLKGEIPLDVSQQVHRNAAARSLTGGYGGTGMAGNLVARDLGLTSLGLTQAGLTSAEGWLRSMEQLYSPSQAIYSSMFITPQQEYAADAHERDLQFQRSWLANQIEAMPNPVARGVFDTVMNLVNSYLGGSYNPSTPNYNPSGVGGSVGGGGGNSIWGWGGGGGIGQDTGALSGGTGALGGGKAGALGAFI